MSDAIKRPKTYEEGLRDGFLKGLENVNKVMEQMLHTACNPIAYVIPETEAIKLLKEQIEKMKRCEICGHYLYNGCNYHSLWVKDCKENGMKLFELKEIEK